MTFQKTKLVSIALGASVLSLGACSYSHPNAMPSGYTHHHEEYKSPTPAGSSKVTVEQRKYMDAAQAEQFRDGIYDLLERLTMRAGMPPKPVYIMAPDPMTTFYANLDNDLRESMRHIGYAISDTPEDAYVFTYEALPLKSLQDQTSNGSDNVQITLRVFNALSKDARQLAEETGQYFIQGVEALSIAPSSYSVLPSQKDIAKRQLLQGEPAPVAMPVVKGPTPVVHTPVARIAPLPALVSKPMVRSPQEPLFAEPVIRRSAPAVSQPEVAVQKSIAPAQKVIPKVKKLIKKPSRDDIVIINRGDKPAMDVSVSDALPTPSVVNTAEPENALQKAIPTAEAVVRGRVSLPADY